MSDNELRDRVHETLMMHRAIASGPGDCVCACKRTWMADADHRAHVAQAIIDDLGLTVMDVPGGISDYSPFTGKPVVQPDRWYVDGERVFIREKQ